jgi:ElaB/YqjD/DUF883 family membrane-anchored ribosome-binding protein
MAIVNGGLPADPQTEVVEAVAPGATRERDRLRGATSASLRAAKSRLARVGSDMRIEARYTAHAAERYARQKPWRVAAAAAALALLVGYLIGARYGSASLRRLPSASLN